MKGNKNLEDLMIKAQGKYESHIFNNNATTVNPPSVTCTLSPRIFLSPPGFFNNSSASYSHERAELFNEYFHLVYQPRSIIPVSFNFSSFTPLPLLLCEVSYCKKDIFTILSSLDMSKAMGIDKIGSKLLKFCAISLYEPITLLLQKCIHLYQTPREWRVHLITPILKSGVPSNITNYRPIALLCSISKVLEKVLFNVIHIHVLPIISPKFGFVKCLSCLNQLLIIMLLYNNSRTHTTTDVIYLDFQKVFDTVSHEERLRKPWNIGITGSLWILLKDYCQGATPSTLP